MERLLSLFGLFAIIGIAYALSSHRKAISWRIVITGLVLQFTFAILILKTGPGQFVFKWTGDRVTELLGFTQVGSGFIFGSLVQNVQGFGFIFAFQVLPTIIFVSSIMAVLYHLGVMQLIVNVIAKVMVKTMGTSGAESLSAAANIFVGQTEAPLLIKPYVTDMTRSELMAIMTGGMATVAGGVLAAYIGMGVPANHLLAASVMAAPAGLLLAKIMVPETEEPKTKGAVQASSEKIDSNVIEAAARGAGEGLSLALNVAAMLLAFIALIAMLNGGLGALGAMVGLPNLSMQLILSYVFAPLAFVMGVGTTWTDVSSFANLLGQKLVLNEFVAYADLSKIVSGAEGALPLSERGAIMATYALCGFANLSSIAIQIGGIGGIAPSARGTISKLGVRAMTAGFLASCMTACIAGVLL